MNKKKNPNKTIKKGIFDKFRDYISSTSVTF